MLSKGDDGMPCPASSDRVCFPRDMRPCHALRRPTVCEVQRRWYYDTLDVFWPYVQSKVYDCMQCPTSSNRVCCWKAMMACHAWRRYRMWFLREMIAFQEWHCQTMCASLRQWWHAMPEVIRPCVLLKGNDGMWVQRCLCVCPKGDNGMPRPT